MVGAVPSSENLADIGTKRLSVLPTMKYLMHNLGVYDSELGGLIRQGEHELKISKQNLRLITTSSNFKVSANLMQLHFFFQLLFMQLCSCPTSLTCSIHTSMDWQWWLHLILTWILLG